MKGVILDTSAYSHIERQHQALTDLIKRFERVILPMAVLAELRSGYRQGSRETTNRRLLDAFLAQPAVSIAWPDENTLERYVTLSVFARQNHRILTHNDLWIAAAAEQLHYHLITFDNDFAVFEPQFAERLHILKP